MQFNLNRRDVLGSAFLIAMQLPAMSATTDAPAIKVVDTGPSSKPVMVFIHGYTCSLQDWSFQIEALAATHRCIAIDLPGHGKTPRSEARIAAMASAVTKTLESLQLEKVILVGHSMGCRVASEAYARMPSRVSGIAWLEGSMLATNDPAANIKKIGDLIDKMGITAFYERSASEFVFDTTPANVRAYIKAGRPNIEADPVFWRDLIVDMVRWDETRGRDVLKLIEVPTLVVQSTVINTELRRVPIGPNSVTPWMEEVSKAVKNSKVERVLGSGHFVMLEQSKKTNELLAEFSRTVSKV